MKKKVIMLVCIVLAVILLIVGGAFLLQHLGVSKVAKLYTDITTKQAYVFSVQNEDKYKYVIAKKNNQASIDMYTSDDMHTTTLVKDGNTYILQHDVKEYIIYQNNDAEASFLENQLESLKDQKHKNGKEEIDGKEYKYEEYTGFSDFMASTNKDIDESTTKTRFYFDGEQLVYIKTMLEDEPYLKVSISYDVSDELFEIPSDYAESSF